jgi:hypothetical protein
MGARARAKREKVKTSFVMLGRARHLCEVPAATTIARATRQWIQQFVIRERLCPFAAASDIQVIVDTFSQDANWQINAAIDADRRIMLEGLDRAQSEVERLLTDRVFSSPTANLFLVWPYGLADMNTFLPFASAVIAHADLASGTGGPEDATKPATAFPFHPFMGRESAAGGPTLRHALRQKGVDAINDFRFVSPYPMLHVIPRAELHKSREQLGSRAKSGGLHLLDRNLKRMRDASDEDRQRWEALLDRCRAVH